MQVMQSIQQLTQLQKDSKQGILAKEGIGCSQVMESSLLASVHAGVSHVPCLAGRWHSDDKGGESSRVSRRAEARHEPLCRKQVILG